MSDPRTHLVEQGYDALGRDFVEWKTQVRGSPRERFLAQLMDLLPDSAQILDLGCGPGLYSTAPLAARFEVVGVDISRSQLALAREMLPGVRFVQADALEYSAPACAFDAVVALYTLPHIPRVHHAMLLTRIAGWLKPSGRLLLSISAREIPDRTLRWLGVPMFMSSFGARTTCDLVRAAGFRIICDDLVVDRQPEAEVPFIWILGEKAGASRAS
jgi:SAM-dependent methyltransferase